MCLTFWGQFPLRGTVFYLRVIYSQLIDEKGTTNIPFEKYVISEKNLKM